jgi:hypothetical protein
VPFELDPKLKEYLTLVEEGKDPIQPGLDRAEEHFARAKEILETDGRRRHPRR